MLKFRSISLLIPCAALALSSAYGSPAHAADDFGDSDFGGFSDFDDGFGGGDDFGGGFDDGGFDDGGFDDGGFDDGGFDDGGFDDGGFDDGGFIDVGFEPPPSASVRICDDGLQLALQESNNEYATFTTVGQAELAHCIQNEYAFATGGDIKINSGTRSVYQQAYAMYTGVYLDKGCSEIRRLYAGDGRSEYVGELCDAADFYARNAADAAERQSLTIADWDAIVQQALDDGHSFSIHMDGASVDIALTGTSSVPLNRAITACGGKRNDEQSHAHVDMSAAASREPLPGDSCD